LLAGFWACSPNRRVKSFALTPVGGLLRSGEPGSLRDLAIMQVDNWVRGKL